MIKTNNLEGSSFCFTGPLNSMTRDQAKSFVEEHGGVFKTSVVNGLDFLVTNNPFSGSIKNRTAQEHGTSIIDEEQFMNLVAGTAGVKFLRLNKLYKKENI